MPLSTLGTVLTWTGIAGCLLFGSYSFIMIAASMGGARMLAEKAKAAARAKLRGEGRAIGAGSGTQKGTLRTHSEGGV